MVKATTDLSLESWPKEGPTVLTSSTETFTASQKDCQIFGFFQGALSGNDGRAAGNGFINHRIGQKFAIQVNPDVTANIGSREVAEFFAPFIGELQCYQRLLVLTHFFLGVLQIFAGQLDIAFLVLKFEDCRLTDGFDGFLGIPFTRKFDNDTIGPFPLDNRFGEAHFIDTLLHDINDLGNRLGGDFVLRRIFRLHDDMGTALQIQPLPDMAGQRSHGGRKGTDNDQDHHPESDESSLSQGAFPFCFQNFNLFSLQ